MTYMERQRKRSGFHMFLHADTDAMLGSDDTWTRVIGAWIMAGRAIIGGLLSGLLVIAVLFAVLLWAGALR